MKRFYKYLTIVCAALAVITTAVEAGVAELVPKLSSDDMTVRYQAQLDLLKAGSNAGRPGAEAERKALCEEMCTLVSGDCPFPAAQQLVRQLQRIGGEESVATLTKLLKHSNASLRDDARQALEVNPSPKATEPLLTELKGAKDPRWTAGLINALGTRGEKSAVKLIIPHLTSSNDFVAEAAVKSLAMMADKSSMAALIKVSKTAKGSRKALYTAGLFDAAYFSAQQGNVSLANWVYTSFFGIGNPDEVRAVAIIGMMKNNPKQVLPLAEQSLADSDALKAAVIQAASQLNHADLNRLVAGKLGQLSEPLQVQALKMLEFSGDHSLAAVVAPLLKSGNETVRDAAADALSKIGTAKSVDALLKTDGDAALNALVCLNADGVDARLHKISSTRASDALARRGDKQIVQKLLSVAGGADEQAAGEALKTLKNVAGMDELSAIVDIMLKKSASSTGRQALGVVVAIVDKNKTPETAKVLVGKLNKADAKGKALMYQALARLGSDEALAPVAASAKSDKDAFSALCKWPDANAVKPLLEIAADKNRPLNDHVQAMRAIARLVSAQKGDVPGGPVSVCNQAMKATRRVDEKKAIIGALGKVMNDNALKTVQSYLQDEELKEAAQAAEKSIQDGMKDSKGKKKKGGRKKKKK